MARILVVDDQPVVLKMLETLLSSKGHVVTCSPEALDALEKVAQQPFEVLITDAIMPGAASGFDLIKTVRKNPLASGMAIILLTGKREKKDVQRGIAAGADDYLVKPVDPDILIAKVDALLKKKGGQEPFVDVPVSEAASLNVEMRIVGVSEVGMSLSSNHPAHVNSKIKLDSDFFEKVGMEPPILRVVSCAPAGDSGYTIRVHFVGITEFSLQPLRVWMRGRSFRQVV